MDVKAIAAKVEKMGYVKIEILEGGINEVAPLEEAMEILQDPPYNYIVTRVHYADDRAGICKNCGSDDCDEKSCSDFATESGCRNCGSDDCECGYFLVTKPN
jgi:hypothetical protein